jgi:hypothetical protein
MADTQHMVVEQVREDLHARQVPDHPEQAPDAEDEYDEPDRLPRQQQVHDRQLERGYEDERPHDRGDLLGVGKGVNARALPGHAPRHEEEQAAPDADLEHHEPADERESTLERGGHHRPPTPEA